MDDSMRFHAELLSIRIEMEGMVAENQQRLHLEQSMAYTEKEFQKVQGRLQNLIGLYLR